MHDSAQWKRTLTRHRKIKPNNLFFTQKSGKNRVGVLSFLGILSQTRPVKNCTYTVGNVTTIYVTTIKIRTELKSTITGTCTEEAFTFSHVYHQGTSQYGHSDSKRNSTTCSYSVNEIEHFGTINYFYHINSQPIAVLNHMWNQAPCWQTLEYLAEKFSNNMRC